MKMEYPEFYAMKKFLNQRLMEPREIYILETGKKDVSPEYTDFLIKWKENILYFEQIMKNQRRAE